ncbi:2-dehydro-3-deoxygalactonokinase [Fulvimarina sp. 2208YS6-2-32]|uniref:2-dehydro-3-deoxygalactonokinase n=1 Tax=Fulvimarina uroteuthidis TaxID=3098149 RepID=A0ABU5HXL1_9HYPH|nr:2-dehydro-3-deoxygalactonokinase [Fulvimarina sp. 2208YS6-2-32]MDY8107882.1 2-dehydro-3-deoxygalactonokinase [Fulvimarina sp. 2208YS6-2-32]
MPDWIAVDWGTSHLRVWLMERSGAAIGQRTSSRGMGTLAPHEFEPVLLDLIADSLPDAGPLPVVCCGMVGARQGWSEAAYASLPCPPPTTETATRVACEDGRIEVFILPGVKQADPPDVMRGEETQIAGFLAQEPAFDGVLCLPGTHTKWVRVSGGEITGLRTFMTGELFALLSTRSVLRHSVGGDAFDAADFRRAVSGIVDDPAGLAARLFSIRAGSLLDGDDPGRSRATLSGLLIGAELAASADIWKGRNVCIIGAGGLSDLYRQAIETKQVSVRTVSGDGMTLAGLVAAYRELRKTHQP